jgi:hypothetical protein
MTPRGQSRVDFLVGIGVFFLTLSFVLVLLPELLGPFAGPENPAVADRATAGLTEDLLAGSAAGTLNLTCTDEFFRAQGSTCGFDATDATTALVGVDDRHELNVTVERNASAAPGTEVLCSNGTAITQCTAGGTPLTRGSDPPTGTQSVRSAHRVVSVGGDVVVIELRVW